MTHRARPAQPIPVTTLPASLAALRATRQRLRTDAADPPRAERLRRPRPRRSSSTPTGRPARQRGAPSRRSAALSFADLRARQRAAEADIAAQGITFTVYADGANIDRAWPMDIVPRVFAAAEWSTIDAGLRQRLAALELLHRRPVPRAALPARRHRPPGPDRSSPGWRPECRGVDPPQRRVGPHLRLRPRARRRRHRLRAGGQPAGALRRLLHAGEPGRHQAGLRRAVRAPVDPPVDRYPERLLETLLLAVPRRRRPRRAC